MCQYETPSPENSVLVLRYLYGLSLDDDIEFMDTSEVKQLYDAGKSLEIPNLCDYALKEVEKRLVRFLDNMLFGPRDGSPSCTDRRLDPFVDILDDLIKTQVREEDDTLPNVMKMLVEICCRYYVVVGQSDCFKQFAHQRPEIYGGMLDYASSQGGDLLGTDPRTGQHVKIGFD